MTGGVRKRDQYGCRKVPCVRDGRICSGLKSWAILLAVQAQGETKIYICQ